MPESGDARFRIEALGTLREEFVTALEAQSEAHAAPARGAREWLVERRRWLAPAVALAVIAAALVLTFVPSRGYLDVDEATAVVAESALNADYAPDDWYTHTDEILTGREYPAIRGGGVGKGYAVREHRRAWLSVTKPGLVITEREGDKPVVVRYPAYADYRIGNQRYSRAELDAFAKDPAPLLRAIDAEVAAAKPADRVLGKWQIITEALRDLAPPLPAEVRASLIRELSTVPGAQVLKAEKDPAGRPAIGLYVDAQGLRDSVYFDRNTSAMTYQSTVALRDGAGGDPDLRAGDELQGFKLIESRAVPTRPANP